jgi:hypothetical protein
MKANKILALAFAYLTAISASSAFAQSSVTNASGTQSRGSKGFVAGLVYSNLSDGKGEFEAKGYRNNVKVIDFSETKHEGIHIGLTGLHLGYKDIYASGTWGINAGIQILRGLNGSEMPSKVNLYKILGDAVLPLNDHLNLSAGLNASYFDGLSGEGVKIFPGLGAQAGAEIRFNEFSLLVGAQLLSMTQEWSNSYNDNGDNFRDEGKATWLTSGVITQLSYTF